jgi:protein-disulfide isomerase
MVKSLILGFSILSMIMVRSGLAQQPPAEESRNATEKMAVEMIVKEYILQHPEVLVESVRLYQDRERAAQRQRSREAAVANLHDLQQDPSSPVTGRESGVTIVEFFDYRCGYCKRAEPAVLKLLAEHPDVRFIFKEFPILGPESSLAAKASLAAARQGAYLKFHQALMGLTGSITMNTIEELAGKQGLDVSKLKVAMESPEVQSALARNRDLGAKLGVNATPTFVVGSELISGAIDTATFERLVAQEKPGSARGAGINSREK